jgi:ketosteroid isomerase-like protein
MASNNGASEEAQIRQRVASWAKALRTKDVDGLLSHSARGIVVFDLTPPLEFKGVVAYRKNRTDWFATFHGPIGYELRDLNVTAGGAVAFCRAPAYRHGTWAKSLTLIAARWISPGRQSTRVGSRALLW